MKYGRIKCRKAGKYLLVKFPYRLMKQWDLAALAASMWMMEEYLLSTEDDPVVAMEVIAKSIKQHLKERRDTEAVG